VLCSLDSCDLGWALVTSCNEHINKTSGSKRQVSSLRSVLLSVFQDGLCFVELCIVFEKWQAGCGLDHPGSR
jgi:hypothetical protein